LNGLVGGAIQSHIQAVVLHFLEQGRCLVKLPQPEKKMQLWVVDSAISACIP
jgi:hypothetical protein